MVQNLRKEFECFEFLLFLLPCVSNKLNRSLYLCTASGHTPTGSVCPICTIFRLPQRSGSKMHRPHKIKKEEIRHLPDFFFFYLIKFVLNGFSFSGNAIPAFFPESIHFNNHAILLPSVLIVCIPSSSRCACSAFMP